MQLSKRWRNRLLHRKNFYILLLFFMALLPRLFALDRYITPDELIWVYRSVQFRQALLDGRWLDTLTTHHPGAVTTWLGAAAHTFQLWLRPELQPVYESIQHVAWFSPENTAAFRWMAHFLTSGRVLTAVTNSAGVVVIFLLLRRLFDSSTAWLGALLLAADPFVAGLSGLFHVDGLMTTFTAVSLLSLAIALHPIKGREGARRFMAVSGAAAALAIAAKSPAVLLPFVAVFFLLLTTFFTQVDALYGRFGRLLQLGGSWLLAYLIVLPVIFPSLWASPPAVLQQLREGSRHVEEVLRPSFFMGTIDFVHGPSFYPIALAFRLSPFVLCGAILSLWLIARQWRRHRQQRWTFLLLAVWVILFLAAVTVAVKKFDRYALPVIPAFIFMAAYGWQALPLPSLKWRRVMQIVVVAGQFVYLAAFTPYLLTAYNPLAGGPRLAAQVLPLGWGEGISAGARWLAGQPQVSEKTAVATIAPALAPFFPGETIFLDDDSWQSADYVIVTAGNRQGDAPGPALWTADAALLHTIRFGGMDQAWVYRRENVQPRSDPVSLLPRPVAFGQRVSLLGARAQPHADAVAVSVRWGLLPGGENGRYTVRLSLQDENGIVWRSVENELVNDVVFRPEHWPPGETPQVTYALPLPPGIPPAVYDVALSLFDAAGAQLSLTTAGGEFLGVEYAVGSVVLSPPDALPLLHEAAVGVPIGALFLDEALLLAEQGPLPETAVAGGRVAVDLLWQARAPLPPNLQLAWQIAGAQYVTPLSGFETGQWRAGEVIREKYLLPVPADLPAGSAPVQAQLLDADGTPLAPPVILGSVTIAAIDRLFALPQTIQQPLDYRFGDGVRLRGVDLSSQTAAAGDAVTVTLYWEVIRPPSQLVTAFVHVIGADGQNVTQSDQWPGGLPVDLWAAGQVIVDRATIEIPPQTPPGTYPLAAGLYTAVDGVRLPVVDSAGTAVSDNRVLLPVSLTVGPADE